MPGSVAAPGASRRWVAFALLLGLFLTLRGYRSREGDQAYRLPIYLHLANPAVYADDPFVRAFDEFNPHRGSFALIDLASRPLGLSAGLFALFVVTFLATCYGADRLARKVWGNSGPGVGLVAAGLVVVAQSGNVGTNHLFEPLLLDRLIAFALGWLALAVAVDAPRSGPALSALAVGLACLVHPSVGLQLAMLLGASWVAWTVLGGRGETRPRTAALALALLASAVVPGLALNLEDSGKLLEGLPVEEFRLLTAELQSPQHMLPHLWRRPQWLAWGCYPLLGLVALAGAGGEPTAARKRLVTVLGLNLLGLAAAWYGIERLGNLKLILFQPFRMATVARGLCLVLVAGHVHRLWDRRTPVDGLRAVLIAVGLTGDWTLVVATLFEGTMAAADLARARQIRAAAWLPSAGFAVLAAGLVFLSRHDTASGHVPMLAATAAALGLSRFATAAPWSGRRVAYRLAACWAVPVAALGAGLIPDGSPAPLRGVRQALVRRCRFAAVPVDDLERLALWCRGHMPADARFVAPPGAKSFRLWSLRSLAFNRAASPYHAAGLADWFARYRDHVGFRGPTESFVRAYLRDKQTLERGYDALPPFEKAALATRQGAGYVVAAAEPAPVCDALRRLHVEGRYAVYRVEDPPAHRESRGEPARIARTVDVLGD